MTALYSLNNHQDEEIAKEVAHGLKERGHQISIDIETLAPGQDWEAVLSEALQSSEVFVSLLTENSIRSQFVMTELGAAQAFRQTSKKMLVIPVVIGGVQIPLPIRNLQAIFAHEQDIPRIVEEINRAITAFIGQRAAEEKQQIEVKRRIESNAAVYIDDAIKSLGVQESRNRWMGNLWYYLGYATLVAGVGYGIYSITQYANANDQH